MQDLQAYLARPGERRRSGSSGSRWKCNFTRRRLSAAGPLHHPRRDAPPTTVDAVPHRRRAMAGDAARRPIAAVSTRPGSPGPTARSKSRRYAVNVDAAEGDLRALFGPELASRLQPEVKYQFDQAATFELALGQRPATTSASRLLYLLVVLLIGEQMLAWSASYHPAAPGEGRGLAEQATQGGGP